MTIRRLRIPCAEFTAHLTRAEEEGDRPANATAHSQPTGPPGGDAVLSMRASGEIGDDAFHQIEEELIGSRWLTARPAMTGEEIATGPSVITDLSVCHFFVVANQLIGSGSAQLEAAVCATGVFAGVRWEGCKPWRRIFC
jgi:hypothetical protein